MRNTYYTLVVQDVYTRKPHYFLCTSWDHAKACLDQVRRKHPTFRSLIVVS